MRKICDPNIGVGKGHGISNTFNAKYKLATLDGRPLRSIIIDPSFDQWLIATIEKPSGPMVAQTQKNIGTIDTNRIGNNGPLVNH